MPVSRQGVSRSLGSRPRFVRDNLVPRTVWLPPRVLERIERGKPPGELVAVLTVLLAAYLKGVTP